MPLRIAVVSYYLPSGSKQGVGFWADRFARELVARGHRVTVISGCPPMPDAPYESVFVDLKGSMRTFRFAMAVARFDLSGFDVLHANGDDYWCWRRRVPAHIRTMHGSCFEEAIHIKGVKERVRMVALGLTEWLATATADRTYLVNPASRRWMPWVRDVLPPGVPLGRLARPTDHPRSVEPSILFVGTYRQRKRGELLVEAFERSVRPAMPEARLWMVCEDCSAAPGVEILGRLSDSELVERYHSAWVFCLPSSFEGFGIPYVEAMAAGLPVVATANPGSIHVLDGGRTGVICEDDQLGLALVTLLADEKERSRLARVGAERAADFDLATVTDAYEDAYYELVAQTGR